MFLKRIFSFFTFLMAILSLTVSIQPVLVLIGYLGASGLIDPLHQFLGGMVGMTLAAFAWRGVHGAKAGEFSVEKIAP